MKKTLVTNPCFYTNQNVYDAALDRIRWLFDEFKNIVVAVSGGKDSTVVFNLAMQVAREKNRLPLTVMWIDQEGEWEATVEEVRNIMEHPDVNPRWYQIPMILFNATSTKEHWLKVWYKEDEHKWMRPRETYSIHDNVYGTERFTELFDAIIKTEYESPCCVIGGVRCEESPSRRVGLTTRATYKWATWGKHLYKPKGHVAMYPLYDWTWSDIWAAIHKNGWSYNAIYDAQYVAGISPMKMRVSNVHHETSVHSLFYMQEAEPKTWEKLTQRIAGIDMAGKLGSEDFWCPKELPHMFKSWTEYRDYLLEKLIDNPEWKKGMAAKFAKMDAQYIGCAGYSALPRVQIQSILTNDWELIKLINWENRPQQITHRKIQKGLLPPDAK